MIRLKLYAGAALALVVSILTFGAVKKRQGKEDAYDELAEEDRNRADAVRDSVRDVERVQPDDIKFRD